MEIIKAFNGNTESEIKGGGLKMFVDWEQLNPSIAKAVMLRPDEIVEGYVVDDKGLNVSIGRKRGRKTSEE